MILISAVLYTLPFYIQSLWWLILFFPPLLFYSIRTKSLTVLSALLWASIISTAHFIPVADALYHMTVGPFYMRLIPGIVLILLCSLYSLTWLLTSNRLVHQTNNPFIQYLIWIGALWIFLLFVDQYLFFMWGRVEGNLFMNPLLPLLQSPLIKLLVKWIGINPSLFIFVTISSTFALPFKRKMLFFSAFFLLLLFPFPSETNKPEWISTVGHLPIQIPSESSYSIIQYRITQLKQQLPDLALIILPESSTGSCPPPTNISMIVGSFENHDSYRFNTLYWLSESTITKFHKRYPVPFAEYLPPILSYEWISNLMFKTTMPIPPSTNSRPQWIINQNITLTPYICSELFGHHTPDASLDNPILAVCNDLWFTMPHFKRLMVYAAQLRALQWHCPVLYISYAYGQFFDQFGNTHAITTSLG